MSTRTAHVNVFSSALSLSIWAGVALAVIGVVLFWAMPESRELIGFLLGAGVLLAVVLLILRRRSIVDDHSEAAPLHLRD